MLSKENYAVRVAAVQGDNLDVVMADANSIIAEKEQAGCCIADVRVTEAMASKLQVSEYDTEMFYRRYAVYVIYLEPVSRRESGET